MEAYAIASTGDEFYYPYANILYCGDVHNSLGSVVTLKAGGVDINCISLLFNPFKIKDYHKEINEILIDAVEYLKGCGDFKSNP